MKQVLAILALAVFCAIAVESFSLSGLFKGKFKNGCDPDPCKHKAKCVLDAKNNTLYTCTCTDGFHGKNCELKTGCNGNPCKKGKCANLKNNPSDFVCNCDAGYVGKKCDTTDPCTKNPCKNGGKCTVDDKLKAVCACPAGWHGNNHCEKRLCNVTQYKSKAFTKDSGKVFIDKEIEKRMVDIEKLADLCHVKLHILKSFTLSPDIRATTFDAKDKTNPGFYIGQALSFHIHNSKDEKLECNEICLAKIPIPNAGAKCFVDGLHAIKFKWSILDPTVLSTGSHVANLTAYNNVRAEQQIGCREIKF